MMLHIVPTFAAYVDNIPTGGQFTVTSCGGSPRLAFYAKGCDETDYYYMIKDYLQLPNVYEVQELGSEWLDVNEGFCEHLEVSPGSRCPYRTDTQYPNARLYINEQVGFVQTGKTGAELKYNGITCRREYYFSKTNGGECLFCPTVTVSDGSDYISYEPENTYCGTGGGKASCVDMCLLHRNDMHSPSAHGYIKGWCYYNPGTNTYDRSCYDSELLRCDLNYYREKVSDKFCTHCPSGPGGEDGYTDTMGTLKTNCRVNCGAGSDENGSWDNGGISLWQP